MARRAVAGWLIAALGTPMARLLPRRFVRAREEHDDGDGRGGEGTTRAGMSGDDVARMYLALVAGPRGGDGASAAPHGQRRRRGRGSATPATVTATAATAAAMATPAGVVTRATAAAAMAAPAVATAPHAMHAAAQHGRLAELRVLLTSERIDVHDAYGWTPLMCAAAAGQRAAVRLLLRHGADPRGRCRVRGTEHTAASLARLAGWPDVADAIELCCATPSAAASPPHAAARDDTQRAAMGTAHLLDVYAAERVRDPAAFRTVPPHTIPPTNIGYRLLRKHGWLGRGHGLGPDERGRAVPLRATRRADRVGLGCDAAAGRRSTCRR